MVTIFPQDQSKMPKQRRATLLSLFSSGEVDRTETSDAFGREDVLFTPAYWQSQLRMRPTLTQRGSHRLGATLREEVVACLLGGHGIPAEIGLVAFGELKTSGLLSAADVAESDVLSILERPLTMVDGRKVRYRFARQKATYIATFLSSCLAIPCTRSHKVIRDRLTEFPGIGLKTASWIVRNWYDSDEVAILDIHILRAGQIAGVFSLDQRLPKDYQEMETAFLDFAKLLGVRASALDALIWQQMRSAGTLALRAHKSYCCSRQQQTYRGGGQCLDQVVVEAAVPQVVVEAA